MKGQLGDKLECDQGKWRLNAEDFQERARKGTRRGRRKMEHLEFGLTLTVLGMGSTLLILYLIGMLMEGINRVFLRREKNEEARG